MQIHASGSFCYGVFCVDLGTCRVGTLTVHKSSRERLIQLGGDRWRRRLQVAFGVSDSGCGEELRIKSGERE
jgi:hypothetical protein